MTREAGLLLMAVIGLAACSPPSVPVIGKPQTPTTLTALDAAKNVPGAIYVVQGGRVWKLKSGNLSALTPADQKIGYPAVTADGQKTAAAIISSGHSEIAVGGADFASLTPLTTAPKDPHNASIDIKPAFSPDGTRLAFMSDRGKCCTDEQIWEGTYAPYRPRQVSFPPDVTGGDDSPAYMPSGTSLVFTAWRSAANDSRNVRAGLQQAGVPSGKPKVLLAPADSDVLDPAPSAGGKLAFVGRRGDTADVEVGGADGSGAAAITSFGDTRQPVWSPDGQSLLFISHHSGSFDLWMVQADGKGDPKRLTWGADIDANSRPAWIG